MNATRDIQASRLGEPATDVDHDRVSVGPAPSLAELSPDASSRIARYIVTSTLERGVAPTAVIGLYADLAGNELAVRYVDRRFMLREVPSDWRELENHVLDLEESARQRGLDLAAAWRRAASVAVPGQDALEQLARLAGTRGSGPKPERSIFDDPEDLDALGDEEDYEATLRTRLDYPPELVDLTADAQQRIRRFAIEERLEHGLAPIELLELYRGLELEDDQRAQQYLDRVYVEREPPADWLDLQAEAGRVVDVAERRGRDAGHLYADLLRASPGMEPLIALRLLFERLLS